MKKWLTILLAAIIALMPIAAMGELNKEKMYLNAAADDSAPEIKTIHITIDTSIDAKGKIVVSLPNGVDAKHPISLNVGDTLNIDVPNADTVTFKCSAVKVVPKQNLVVSGKTANITPIAAAKSLSVTVAVVMKKETTVNGKTKVSVLKKSVTVPITVVDPYLATDIAIKRLPEYLIAGRTLDLSRYVSVTPSYAHRESPNYLTYKVSGSAKLAAKNGTVIVGTTGGTEAKPKYATITISSKQNGKVKATAKIPVLSNKVENLSNKPVKSDYNAIADKWTMWPDSVEVDKKGNLLCKYYVLNGTQLNISQLENMELTIAVGSPFNIIARGRFQKTKFSVSKKNSKILKATLTPTVDMSNVFLPEYYKKGTLYFGLNKDTVYAVFKETHLPFLPTKFPQRITEVELTRGAVSLNPGETLNLEATTRSTYDDIVPGLVWSSSDSSVAEVSSQGVVKAKSAGTAEITATADDGTNGSASCMISVISPVEDVAWEQFDDNLSDMIATYEDNVSISDEEGDFATARLIIGAENGVPDLSAYSPLAVATDPMGNYIIQFSSDTDAQACADYLASSGDVGYAEPDAIIACDEIVPDEIISKSVGWGVSAVHADEYAENLLARGKNREIVVAVVDSGVDASHSMLAGRCLSGWDFIGNDSNPNDEKGHGTHVAGTIVDCTPGLNVRILPVRVLNRDGKGTTSTVCQGIRYAATHGASVINMSLSGPVSVYKEEMVKYAVRTRGVVCCAAAGNERDDWFVSHDTKDYSPACIRDCITVSAIDTDYTIAWFSNYGDSVDIAAPGVNIRSAILNHDYGYKNGTSMATPHVAAAAAMLLLDFPSLTPAQVESRLRGAATDLGSSGWDRDFGAGLLNLEPFISYQGLTYGTLTGRVCKASDYSTPIRGARLDFIRENTTLNYGVTVDDNGNFSRELPTGNYHVFVYQDGYISMELYATVNNNEVVSLGTLPLIEGDRDTIGTAHGKVVSSANGAGVGNTNIKVREYWNNATGTVLYEMTADANGVYYLSLPQGYYTLEASHDGYITNCFNVVVQTAASDRSQNGTLTPEIVDGGELKIILTWDVNPRDLDSHVVGWRSDSSQFHVYYSNKNASDNGERICNLDVDDTTSYGPETITLKPNTHNPYYYYIHHFAGSGAISTSGAKIEVFQNGRLVNTFNAPTNQQDTRYWNVFAYVDGRIIPWNTYTTTPDVSYYVGDLAGNAQALFGLKYDLDLTDLPEKEDDPNAEEVDPGSTIFEPDFKVLSALKEIGDFAFEGIDAANVYIPDTCVSIGSCAFRNAAIKKIRIPAGCAIADTAFDGCEGVQIFGTVGSAAEAFCNSHDNCTFVAE